jgi:hypothetical protein
MMAKQFGEEARSWTDLADVASEMGHAEWRNELLSFLLYPPEPVPASSPVVPLRRAV